MSQNNILVKHKLEEKMHSQFENIKSENRFTLNLVHIVLKQSKSPLSIIFKLSEFLQNLPTYFLF